MLICYLWLGVTDSDNVFSYRDVPSFGRDSIRKFSNNVSGLKRLAARDFEDLLQVCYSKLFYISWSDNFSVPFRFLMVFYLINTTELLLNSCLSWPHGMACPNCNFIRKQVFKISKIQLLVWGIYFENSRRQYVLNMTHMIYQVKRQHAVDSGPRKLLHLHLLTSMPTLGLRKMNSFCRRRERRK